MTETFLIHCGACPSDNKHFTVARSRLILTSTYRNWREANEKLFALHAREVGWTTLDKPCRLELRCNLTRKRDITNLFKAAGDALERSGVIKNDNLVDAAFVFRTSLGREGRLISLGEMEIIVEQITNNEVSK